MHAGRAGRLGELSVPSPQFYREPKTALENKVYYQKTKQTRSCQGNRALDGQPPLNICPNYTDPGEVTLSPPRPRDLSQVCRPAPPRGGLRGWGAGLEGQPLPQGGEGL